MWRDVSGRPEVVIACGAVQVSELKSTKIVLFAKCSLICYSTSERIAVVLFAMGDSVRTTY